MYVVHDSEVCRDFYGLLRTFFSHFENFVTKKKQYKNHQIFDFEWPKKLGSHFLPYIYVNGNVIFPKNSI